MSDRPATKQDLDSIQTKLGQRIDSVETKLKIVAQRVAWLTWEAVTRAELAALEARIQAEMATMREELGWDIARHVQAGFKMMSDQLGLYSDRSRTLEDNTAELRADFTAHTNDFVLHNKP